MPFCKNCGAQIPDNATFCNSCGTPVNAAQTQQNTAPVNPQVMNNPVDDAADAQNNKAMGVLSYLGILVLIPFFAAKDSKFAQFHARQGITLAIFEIAYSILNAILTAILGAIFPLKYGFLTGYTHGVVYSIITTILSLVSIVFFVLAIIGIVNACQGKKTELPFIGKIDFIAMFTKKK